MEKNTLNLYFRKNRMKAKLLVGYKRISFNRKSKIKLLVNSLGLKCITERKEIKGLDDKFVSNVLVDWNLISGLFRKRLAFWVENLSTYRTYKISIDHCERKGNILQELEIEYCGRYVPGKYSLKVKKYIIEDIAQLTRSLLDNFPFLHQTTLEKEKWSARN